MSGPLSALRFAHAAIVRESEEIEETAAHLTDAASAEALARRIEFFAGFMKEHGDAEERSILPALSGRLPHADVVYLQDHQEETWLFNELRALSRAVAQGDRGDALTRLRRQTIALVERSQAHVLRENTIVIPQLEALLSTAEQAAVYQRLARHLAPSLDATLPWLIQRLSPVLRAEFLDSLQETIPPEQFRELSAGAWQDAVEDS